MTTDDKPDLLTVFEARVDKTGDCWLWTGGRQSRGYGWFPEGRVLAHRFSVQAPAGTVVRHRCDNPPCVRPDHLLIGTQRENMRDMVERGRHSSRPKLAHYLVAYCRRLVALGVEQQALAARFGVAESTMSRYIGGRG